MNIFDIDLNELIIEVYQEFDSQLTQVQTVNVENILSSISVQVQEDYAPVQSVNGKIGWVVIDKNDVGLSNVENVSILGASGNIQNQINNLSGDTNANFYPRSNPSGFVTGVNLSAYVTTGQTGDFYPRSNPSGFVTGVDTSSLYPRSNPSGFVTGVDTSSLYPRSNPSGFVTGVDTSSLYPRSNPSGFVTGVNLSAYVTTGQTGDFYPRSNPSGFVTGVDLSSYATSSNLANTGSTLDNKINVLSGSSVLLYGNQTISGLKDFTTRPTVNTIPVLLSGEVNTTISGVLYSAQINIKNDNGSTIYKGQPVYVSSAAGTNILVKLASNSGEQTSSKTLGLVYQTSLAQNAQGTIVTEGLLQGFNTNAGEEGDPIWLGPTGSLIFGLANKPYAPNHLVYLGVLTRKHANQGEVFVKIQNGFELEELHNVNINHKNVLNNDDILRYNSASGLWFNETLNTGIFQTQINSLSGSSVLLYGNQTISGVKSFTNNVNITGDLILSGQYNVKTQIENTKKIAIAYAIAL